MSPTVFLLAFGLAALANLAVVDGSNNKTKLHVLGLFPLDGPYKEQQAIGPSAELAQRDINANPDILPDYELVIVPRDSGCDAGKGINVMYRELYNQSRTLMMILGAFCSVTTNPTAQASHHWNLIQISYASTSPTLSDRSLFPRFFRLSPTDFVVNDGRIAFCKHFGWKKVATIHQSVAIFSVTMAGFHRDAEDAGIEVIAAESFIDNPTTQVENIKNSGARIIVAAFYETHGRRIFCEAYRQKLFGAKYVWMLMGWTQWQWWRFLDDSIDCTVEHMDAVAASHFDIVAESLPPDATRAPSLSGMSTSEFLERFKVIANNEHPERMTGYAEVSFTYDTIWTAALALDEAERKLGQLKPPRTLTDFAYDSITADILFDIISNTSFQGISGPVSFAPTGERLSRVLFRQLQDGVRPSIGIMDPTVGSGEDIVFDGYEPIYWPGGAPPIDFIIEREDRRTIKLSLFILGAILASLGIALASCFLAFNIHFRKLRVIKMSSPNINNLMLIGGMLAYVSIIFLGVDTNLASTDAFVWMCKAKTWFLSIGFSLAFGSMFSKTWRVHKIFTNKTVIKTVVKDHRLLASVGVLVILDVLILILWEVIDPVVAVERFGAKVVDDENDDIVYTPIRMMCESGNQTYWIGAFYVIDGLLLVFGAFLAWETRKVSIPALNDSKYIGICVYNVLILSFVGAPVSFILEERNAHYVLVASLIWLATTLTLCVVFVPKVRMRNDIQPAHSMITVVSQNSHSQHGGSSSDSVELSLLRQEIQRMKKNCKCSA